MTSRRFALIGAHLREDDLRGISGVTPLRAADLVLSSFPYDPATGLADQSVLRRVLELRAELIEREIFVAIRYGASAASEPEAAAKVAPYADRWRELLQEHRGMVELILKVAAPQPPEPVDKTRFKSGGDYLRELHRRRSAVHTDPQFRVLADELFQAVARKRRWVPRAEGGEEMAMLVERARIDHAAEAARTLQARASAVPFLLTGPWPLEIFADEP